MEEEGLKLFAESEKKATGLAIITDVMMIGTSLDRQYAM